jgi:hypothetical protein
VSRQAAVQALFRYFQAAAATEVSPEVVAVIKMFGQKINFNPS